MLARCVLAKLPNDEALLRRIYTILDELHLSMTLDESRPREKRRRGLPRVLGVVSGLS